MRERERESEREKERTRERERTNDLPVHALYPVGGLDDE